MRLTNIAVCWLFVLSTAGCLEENVEPALPDGPAAKVDISAGLEASVKADAQSKKCGACSGSNCCCSGLDSECEAGYLCYKDGLCLLYDQFNLNVSFSGTISDKGPGGTPWDQDGKPDPYLIVKGASSDLCTSQAAAKDTTAANLKCQYPMKAAHKAMVTIRVVDMDGSKQTVIYEASLAGGLQLKHIGHAGFKLPAGPTMTAPKVIITKRTN